VHQDSFHIQQCATGMAEFSVTRSKADQQLQGWHCYDSSISQQTLPERPRVQGTEQVKGLSII
jgi:hypothetical protein